MKKYLSIILAISLILSCFSMLGGLVLAADFSELTTTQTISFQKNGTMTYENINEMFAAGWNGYQISTTQGTLGTSLTNNLTAVTFETAYPSAEEDYYAGYGVSSTFNKHTVYAGSTVVDWNNTIVDSVTYTFVPKSYGDVRYSQDKGTIIPIGMDGKCLMTYIDGQGQVRFTSKVKGLENHNSTLASYYYNGAQVTQNNFPGYNANDGIYSDNGLAAEMTVKINYEKTTEIDETSGNYIYKVASLEYSISDNVVVGKSGATVTSSYTYSSGKTLVVTPATEISTAYPMVAIPTTAGIETAKGNANLQQTYTKSITIVSHADPNEKISDFLEKYNTVENITTDTLAGLDASSAEFIAYSTAVSEALAIYENYDADRKAYVGEDRYNHLIELKGQIYKMTELQDEIAAVKQNAVLKDDFSNVSFSSNLWKLNILGWSDNGYNPSTDIGGFFTTNVNVSRAVLAEQHTLRRFGYATEADVKPECVDLTQSDGTLNLNFRVPDIGKYSNKTEPAFDLHTNAFQATVNSDYIPDDIKRISGKLRLEQGSVMLLFGDLEGCNYPINASTTDAQKDDLPTVGIKINIGEDGKLTYNLVKITNTTVTGESGTYISTNDILYTYSTSSVISYDYNGSTLRTGALDMTKEYFTFELEFVPATYNQTTVLVPQLTLSDGTTTLSGQVRNTSISSSFGPYYATSITGLSIGQFIAQDVDTSASDRGVYNTTVIIDDIEIIGAGATTVEGATIKTSANADEQDIKFVMNFYGENNSLIADGYTVKEYGAVVAIKGALANVSEPLTLDSVYDSAYTEQFVAPVKVTASNKDIPEGEVTLTIGESAAGAERLGLIYRVRAFAIYEKAEEEDVIVYSSTDCDRSIYSTGKKIAKTIQNMEGFIENDTYLVAGRQTTYAEIKSIIDGNDKSGTTFEGSTVSYGEALIAFTAAHSSMFANS